MSNRALPESGCDPFDLWLRLSIRDQWGLLPEAEATPDELVRLACDSSPEWRELAEKWLGKGQRQQHPRRQEDVHKR